MWQIRHSAVEDEQTEPFLDGTLAAISLRGVQLSHPLASLSLGSADSSTSLTISGWCSVENIDDGDACCSSGGSVSNGHGGVRAQSCIVLLLSDPLPESADVVECASSASSPAVLRDGRSGFSGSLPSVETFGIALADIRPSASASANQPAPTDRRQSARPPAAVTTQFRRLLRAEGRNAAALLLLLVMPVHNHRQWRRLEE